jgi:hypothetical protein
MEVNVHYTTAVAVLNRYAELIRLKEEKASSKMRHKPTEVSEAKFQHQPDLFQTGRPIFAAEV